MKLSLKIFIANLLTAAPVGKLVKFFSSGILHKQDIKINVSSSQVSPKIIATLYWGFYESAEIRFVKKYIRTDLPIIELGTSLGIIACIAAKKTRQKIICVEANPFLIPAIKENFKLNEIGNYELINAAISTENNSELFFEKGSMNTTGKVTTEQTATSVLINQIKLSDILENKQLKDYILICDIEGAEVSIIINNSKALQNCKQLIIETHQTKFNNKLMMPSDIKNKIIELGFILKDEYGANYVFEKT